MLPHVPGDANALVEERLEGLAEEISGLRDSDVIAAYSPILFHVDSLIKDAIEDCKTDGRDRLTFILQTTGGYVEVVQRIVDVLRKHYNHVEFIVPNFAFSAGTVLAMSGDAIFMDYFSVLGPIDPQTQTPEGSRLVPAMGILVQYDRLIEKSKQGDLTSAELAYLISKFDPAERYGIEQQRELSITLLKEWLVRFKFKDWTVTEDRGVEVTHEMKEASAEEIANRLNDTDLWHSHGRGISMQVLREVLKLQIEDFGDDDGLNQRVRDYHRLLFDYMNKRGYNGVIHTRDRLNPFLRGEYM